MFLFYFVSVLRGLHVCNKFRSRFLTPNFLVHLAVYFFKLSIIIHNITSFRVVIYSLSFFCPCHALFSGSCSPDLPIKNIFNGLRCSTHTHTHTNRKYRRNKPPYVCVPHIGCTYTIHTLESGYNKEHMAEYSDFYF